MARIIIVGGGLSGALLAYRLRAARPALDLCLAEAGPRLGGNHTWSFHESDLDSSRHDWIAPFVAHSWAAQEVRFPSLSRRLAIGYRSITSQRLDAVTRAALGHAVLLGEPVSELGETGVTLASGRRLDADIVIDARGCPPEHAFTLAYQKFLGLEVETEVPHGLDAPIIMDATVDQHDGYRFVYTLPLAPDRLLIEDTTYSDGPSLPRESLRARIHAYAAQNGWRTARVVREEDGVLPILLAGEAAALGAAFEQGPIPIGLSAGFFHPTTGYSLPDAVRVAERIANLDDDALTRETVRRVLRDMAQEQWRSRAFFRLLNRMLFRAGRPEARYRVLERFYRLPAPLIRRFYRGEIMAADKLRLVLGKPPVPLMEALRCLPEGRSHSGKQSATRPPSGPDRPPS